MRQDSGHLKWQPSGLLNRLKHVGSSKNLKEPHKDFNVGDFPTDADAYELLAECGRGVSATVYHAVCKSNNQEVAVKKLNLDTFESKELDVIIQEAQTMRSHEHPNLLPLLCSFVHQDSLWMVEPFVSNGSVLNIMKYRYQSGLDETSLALILRETLQGLEYIHRNGMIHRDVKAGNILIGGDGQVLLADFGVSTRLERGASWGGKAQRTTFIGTMCWMAPEVMEQTGYDQSADIWSLGITILELAHGHAPFAKYPPMRVLMMTVQNPPPSLDDAAGDGCDKKKFSRELHDLVAQCLQKDPAKRPLAKDLLEHRFFRKYAHIQPRAHLQKHLLHDLPNVVTRVAHMKTGVAGLWCSDSREAAVKSQEEYIKGVSAWNFDVAALKAQAELEPMPPMAEGDEEEHNAGLAHDPRGSVTWSDAGPSSSHVSSFSHPAAPPHDAEPHQQRAHDLPEDSSGRFRRKTSFDPERLHGQSFAGASRPAVSEEMSVMSQIDQHEASIGSTINANVYSRLIHNAENPGSSASSPLRVNGERRSLSPDVGTPDRVTSAAVGSSPSPAGGAAPPGGLVLESYLSIDQSSRKTGTGRFREKMPNDDDGGSNAGGSVHHREFRASTDGLMTGPLPVSDINVASSAYGHEELTLRTTNPAVLLEAPRPADPVAAQPAKHGRFLVLDQKTTSVDGTATDGTATPNNDGSLSPIAQMEPLRSEALAAVVVLQPGAHASQSLPMPIPAPRQSDAHSMSAQPSNDGEAPLLDPRSSAGSQTPSVRPDGDGSVVPPILAVPSRVLDAGAVRQQGRFQVESEKGQPPEVVPRISSAQLLREETARMTAAAAHTLPPSPSATPAPHGPLAAPQDLSDKLQELLINSRMQQDGLRLLMQAMLDPVKGKEELLKHQLLATLVSPAPLHEVQAENIRLRAEVDELRKNQEELKKKLKATKKELSIVMTQKADVRRAAADIPAHARLGPVASDASLPSVPPTRPGSPRGAATGVPPHPIDAAPVASAAADAAGRASAGSAPAPPAEKDAHAASVPGGLDVAASSRARACSILRGSDSKPTFLVWQDVQRTASTDSVPAADLRVSLQYTSSGGSDVSMTHRVTGRSSRPEVPRHTSGHELSVVPEAGSRSDSAMSHNVKVTQWRVGADFTRVPSENGRGSHETLEAVATAAEAAATAAAAAAPAVVFDFAPLRLDDGAKADLTQGSSTPSLAADADASLLAQSAAEESAALTHAGALADGDTAAASSGDQGSSSTQLLRQQTLAGTPSASSLSLNVLVLPTPRPSTPPDVAPEIPEHEAAPAQAAPPPAAPPLLPPAAAKQALDRSQSVPSPRAALTDAPPERQSAPPALTAVDLGAVSAPAPHPRGRGGHGIGARLKNAGRALGRNFSLLLPAGGRKDSSEQASLAHPSEAHKVSPSSKSFNAIRNHVFQLEAAEGHAREGGEPSAAAAQPSHADKGPADRDSTASDVWPPHPAIRMGTLGASAPLGQDDAALRRGSAGPSRSNPASPGGGRMRRVLTTPSMPRPRSSLAMLGCLGVHRERESPPDGAADETVRAPRT